MIKTRREILSINPIFTMFILDLQRSYKPEPYEEGEGVDSISFNLIGDKNGITILTKEQAEYLTQEVFTEFESNLDENPFSNSTDLNFIENHLIISPKENSKEYLKDIAKAINSIMKELNEAHLIIIGVQNIPWLFQENDYLPVKVAIDFLKTKIDNNFDGGFLLNKSEIEDFIPHLFWLTRCNASLPQFYFSFPNSKTMISICKYGVLHFEFYDQEEKLKILKTLSTQNFKEVDRCGDPVEFDNFKERKLILKSGVFNRFVNSFLMT